MRGSSCVRRPALMSIRTLTLLLSLVIGVNYLASCALTEDVRENEGASPLTSEESEEEVKQYDDLTITSSDDASELLKLGISSANEGRYDEAIPSLDAAIEISPVGPRAYLYRGVVSGIRGDYESAAQDHEIALKAELLSPEDAAIQHEQWRSSITMKAIYLRSGDYDKAIEDYDTFIRVSPDAADAYMWRGCAYYLKGEPSRAIVDYDKALALSPDNALALYKRGLAHARLGESSRANQDFARAMAIGFDEAMAESGEEGQQSYSVSQNMFDHEQGIFHYDRAFSRLGQADYDGAVADMDRARTLINPQTIEQYADGMHRVYFQSGVAYYDTGLYDDAIRLLDKAIDVAASPSDYPAAYYQRGMSHYRKGNHRRAIADFDKVIHLEQSFPDAAHYSKLSQEELAK